MKRANSLVVVSICAIVLAGGCSTIAQRARHPDYAKMPGSARYHLDRVRVRAAVDDGSTSEIAEDILRLLLLRGSSKQASHGLLLSANIYETLFEQNLDIVYSVTVELTIATEDGTIAKSGIYISEDTRSIASARRLHRVIVRALRRML